MRGAKPPLVFVVAVVGFLVVGAFALVVLAAGPGRDGSGRADQVAQATRKPTGSSITAAAPRPLTGAGLPQPDASADEPTTTAPSPTTSARARPASSPPAAPGPTALGTPMTVSYSVTGPAAATVLTYWRGDHDIASEHGTALPWSRTVTLTDQGLIRLSAQVDHGTVRCAITVDGQVVAEATADYFVSCETRPAPATHDR